MANIIQLVVHIHKSGPGNVDQAKRWSTLPLGPDLCMLTYQLINICYIIHLYHSKFK